MATDARRADKGPSANVDVLVIGAGLAGTTAAVALARAGRKVAVSHAALGHTANFSGVWKLAFSRAVLVGASSQSALDIASHVRDIALHEPHHPFARIGGGAAAAALEQSVSSLSPVIAQPLSQPLTACPVSHGTLQVGMAAAHLATWPQGPQAGSIAVVDAASWGAALDARVTMGWQEDARRLALQPAQLNSVALPVAADAPSWASAHAIGCARYLDTDEGFARFAQALEQVVPKQASAVWLPSVVGLEQHAARMDALAARLGKPVFEVAANDGVVPGFRRAQALAALLRQKNITVFGKTERCQFRDDALEAICGDGRAIVAHALVLATGRFIGGGLRWRGQERCQESLFGWPLNSLDAPAVQRSPLDLTNPAARAPQQIEVAGVQTDAFCRPLVQVGANVPIAVIGGLQGGWFERTTPSSDGVALATGAHAAAHIAETLGAPSPMAKGA